MFVCISVRVCHSCHVQMLTFTFELLCGIAVTSLTSLHNDGLKKVALNHFLQSELNVASN